MSVMSTPTLTNDVEERRGGQLDEAATTPAAAVPVKVSIGTKIAVRHRHEKLHPEPRRQAGICPWLPYRGCGGKECTRMYTDTLKLNFMPLAGLMAMLIGGLPVCRLWTIILLAQ